MTGGRGKEYSLMSKKDHLPSNQHSNVLRYSLSRGGKGRQVDVCHRRRCEAILQGGQQFCAESLRGESALVHLLVEEEEEEGETCRDGASRLVGQCNAEEGATWQQVEPCRLRSPWDACIHTSATEEYVERLALI